MHEAQLASTRRATRTLTSSDASLDMTYAFLAGSTASGTMAQRQITSSCNYPLERECSFQFGNIACYPCVFLQESLQVRNSCQLSTARIGLWQDRKNLAVLFSDGCAVFARIAASRGGGYAAVACTNMKTRPLFPSAVESGGKHAEARLCSSCLCGWALGWLDTIISHHGRPCLVKKP